MTVNTSSTSYLISGANRGIGLGIVHQILQHDSQAIIFAGARSPSKATELNELAKKHSNVHVVELIVDDRDSNFKAVEEVKKVVGKLDVVIANAGIVSSHGLVHELDGEEAKTVFNVNVLGPVYLYQAAYPIFVAGRKAGDGRAPLFLVTSSLAGSIGIGPIPFPINSYGASKAAVNYLVAKIHGESAESGLIAIPWHPGMVLSDMGNAAIEGFTNNPEIKAVINQMAAGNGGKLGVTVEESAADAWRIISTATRETLGGKFVDVDHPEGGLPW